MKAAIASPEIAQYRHRAMRHESLYPYFAELSSLSGIGPKTAPALERLVGGNKVRDLLFHMPVRWIDRRPRPSIFDTVVGEVSTFRGWVDSVQIGRGSAPARIRISDETSSVTLVYFRAQPIWLQRTFTLNAKVVVSGEIELYNDQKQIVHPDYVVAEDAKEQPPEVEPVYPLASGVTSRILRKAIADALSRSNELEEWVNPDLLVKFKWPSFKDALAQVHTPSTYDLDAMETARTRLAYDEALHREFELVAIRAQRTKAKSHTIPQNPHAMNALLDNLSFAPTAAQLKAIKIIGTELSRTIPMMRLLQGDVGTGKTLVAALAVTQCAAACKASAIMAPTEVLARQLNDAINAFLNPIGYRSRALTGRTNKAQRQDIVRGLESNEIHCVCGTQALFQSGLEFPNLALVVIDEQHRFGVNDRNKLIAKGIAPHLLMMSATPIPRTLSSAIHGELDVTILDERPANRQPVTTRIIPENRTDEIMSAIARAIPRGERIFWICPKVESEDQDDASVTERQKMLEKYLGQKIGLLHGRMSSDEKDGAIQSFKDGHTKVLVSTTVVEVGVDIPDATIIVIERSENFGLAQLHQLRGRVGRGNKPGYCLLLYQHPLSEISQKRLNVLRETLDGFEIAEADFKLRGPGDLLGIRQSGLPNFRILNLVKDAGLLKSAQDDAHHAAISNNAKRMAAIALLKELWNFTQDQEPAAM